mgnify:CR=1 FL=1
MQQTISKVIRSKFVVILRANFTATLVTTACCTSFLNNHPEKNFNGEFCLFYTTDIIGLAVSIGVVATVQILTGIEADILNSSGSLDVTDDVLSKLDFVIASFHYYPWAANNFAGGEKRHIGIREILMAYERVVANPHVDVLGHPTADIQRYNRGISFLTEWEPLLKIMRMTGTAFELNLSNLLRVKDQDEFDLRVINLATKHGVNFLVGLDLHNLKMFGSGLSPNFIIDEETVDKAFDKNRGNANMNFFYSLKRLIRLLKISGLTQEMIVNSNNDKFKKWLGSRK